MFRSLFSQRKTKGGNQVQRMTVNELHDRLQQGKDLLLLDVRTPYEYEADGHINGARLIPLAALSGRIDELPENRPVVCICRSGNRSQAAAEWLAGAGHKEVYNLVGGMMDWHRLPAAG